MVVSMTDRERSLFRCAHMILLDQCPPEREHYLCMYSEDDTAAECTLCWDNYLWNVVKGTAFATTTPPAHPDNSLAAVHLF